MSCNKPACQLNEELLALLPTLEVEQQQRILQRWNDLDLAERKVVLHTASGPVDAGADLVTLAKLADYFQCGVYDMVRYTRPEHER